MNMQDKCILCKCYCINRYMCCLFFIIHCQTVGFVGKGVDYELTLSVLGSSYLVLDLKGWES